MEHPRANDGEWQNGLCSHICGAGDCGICWGAWCCGPCLFGRTTQRMDMFPNTDKNAIEIFDGCCALFCGLGYCFGLHWVPMMFKRGELRDQHGIRGNGCTDCMVSFFCTPCGLAQMETEIKDRAEKAQLLPPGAGHEKQPYQQQQGMVYQEPMMAPQQQVQQQQTGVAYPPPVKGQQPNY